jgi:arsenate reductase
MMEVKILHNPRCSKSRETLQILQDQGIEPAIVEYLKTPPTTKELADILAMLDMNPRELMRKNEDAYKALDLGNPNLPDDELIQAMVDYPILIERPIVITNGKAAIGRPPESVLEIV